MLTAAGVGLSYRGVYGLDLVKIFPVSPDTMPPALLTIEVLGTVLSLPLLLLSVQAMQTSSQRIVADTAVSLLNNPRRFQPLRIFMALGLGLLAFGIITFATSAAMGL